MLLNGPNIESQDFEESQACLTIAQLVIFNMKRSRNWPLRVTVIIKIGKRHCLFTLEWVQTRSKKFVNQLYELGLSVSYQRVDDIMNNFSDICLRPFQVCWCCLPCFLTKWLVHRWSHWQSWSWPILNNGTGLISWNWDKFVPVPKASAKG